MGKDKLEEYEEGQSPDLVAGRTRIIMADTDTELTGFVLGTVFVLCTWGFASSFISRTPDDPFLLIRYYVRCWIYETDTVSALRVPIV